MEFSWSYVDSMRRMAVNTGLGTSNGTFQNGYCPIMLTFDINPQGISVIPTFCVTAAQKLVTDEQEPVNVIIPLSIDNYGRTATGAETILKYFSRNLCCYGQLAKVITPKGEVYYGNCGIILDKNFNPLMLSTREVKREGNGIVRDIATIHLSPRVFTNDQAVLNKSLAKKGIAYYLSNVVTSFPESFNVSHTPVVIDDMSGFFKKVVKPDVNHSSAKDFNAVLKDNIDEVLRQFIDDLPCRNR